jgi:alkylated DNA repair dioxygenase AlkB
MIRVYFEKNPDKLMEFINSLPPADNSNKNELIKKHKEFAGWNIKDKMLEAAQKYTKSKILVEFACGRANDFNRWPKHQFNKVIGIDYDIEQIVEGRNRIRDPKWYKKHSNLDVNLFVGSVTNINVVNEALKQLKEVPLIVCNFAINHMNLEDLFYVLSQKISRGGLFIGTATDGNVINNLFDLFKNDNNDVNLRLSKLHKISDMEYTFFMNSDYFKDDDKEIPIKEKIVTPENLEIIANKYGFIKYQLLQKEVPEIFGFMDVPVEPAYKDRPVDLAFYFFGFSFVKIVEGTPAKGLIIIPYRDRKKHLLSLVKHLEGSSIDIVVVEQSPGYKFNRGLLINIVCSYLQKNLNEYTYYIIHDVDLLPDKKLLGYYHKFPTVPIHLGSRGQRYSTDKNFLGGVLSISKYDFERINGFPNNFWGWGSEDEVLRDRIKFASGVPFNSSKKEYIEIPKEGSVQDLEGYSIEQKLESLKGLKLDNKDELKKIEKENLQKEIFINGLSDLPNIPFELIKRKIANTEVVWFKAQCDGPDESMIPVDEIVEESSKESIEKSSKESAKESIQSTKDQPIPGLTIIENYISPEEERALYEEINKLQWNNIPGNKLNRRTQQYITAYDYKSRGSSRFPAPDVPQEAIHLRELFERIKNEFFNGKYPEQIIINEYEVGQGISRHTDKDIFGTPIITVSLGSSVNFDFLKESQKKSFYLKPGTLVSMDGESREKWEHEITPTKTDWVNGKRIKRGPLPRISVTCRIYA